MTPHAHQWQLSAEHSSARTRRYRCATCPCWGWRNDRKTSHVVAFAHAPSAETVEAWKTEASR